MSSLFTGTTRAANLSLDHGETSQMCELARTARGGTYLAVDGSCFDGGEDRLLGTYTQ